MSGLYDLGTGVFLLLEAAPARPQGVTVWQHVDANAPMPYVRVGEMTETPRRQFKRRGWEDTLLLHVFSEQPGDAEALEIVRWLTMSLDARTVTAGSLAWGAMRVSSATVSTDPDGTYHARVRIRARVLEATSSP